MVKKESRSSKSDTRFAIVRASRLLDIAFEFNAYEKSFDGDPCRGAFRLAAVTLNVLEIDGEVIVERAVNTNECTPKDLSRYIKELADENADSD